MSLTVYAETGVNQQLSQAIDEALEQLLGREASRRFCNYIEKRFMLARNEFSTKPEVFSGALRTVFGVASKHIEKDILKRYYRKLGVELDPAKPLSFVDAVRSRVQATLIRWWLPAPVSSSNCPSPYSRQVIGARYKHRNELRYYIDNIPMLSGLRILPSQQ